MARRHRHQDTMEAHHIRRPPCLCPSGGVGPPEVVPLGRVRLEIATWLVTKLEELQISSRLSKCSTTPSASFAKKDPMPPLLEI